MKLKLLLIAFALYVIAIHADTASCGAVFNDTFDEAGSLPDEWTEYNTSGRVTVENGYMKFNHNTSKPSAYRTFASVSTNCYFSFDVEASRNTVNCQVHLMSDAGKYIASFAIGKGTTSIKYATSIASNIPADYTDASPKVTLLKNTNYALSASVDFTNQLVSFYCDGELMAEDVPFLEPATDVSKIDIQLLYMYANSGTFFFDNITLNAVGDERLDLMDAYIKAQQVYNDANIGLQIGDYLQADADIFQLALDEASAMINDCAASTSALTSALNDLQAAEETFLASIIEVCGSVFEDTFSGDSLPDVWTEYNTTDSVRVEDGYLKFNHSSIKPSAYRTFSPVDEDFYFSFEIQGSRSSVNCQTHLVSSTGQYIASVVAGKDGTATIKYATAISSGIPASFTDATTKVTFYTNTVYTISVFANFSNQTVDIYCDGELMVADHPFLESATDVAKVDIQLLYMYSNSGTFFFDNISLIETSASWVDLKNEMVVCEELLSDATVGDGFREYPQEDATAFQNAIDDASRMTTDCGATEAALAAALVDLQTAKENFSLAYNDPEALKLYSAYNFGGQEKAYVCGYYNGTLGDFEDKAVSFTLDAGYMVTFAQDVNGLGVSKVYIAQDNALAINLPVDLQYSISFMRVSPWYPVGKKGSLGDVKWSSSDNYNTTWYYNWGLNPTNTTASDTVQFVPMSWSGGGSLANMERLGKDMTLNHHLAFNEPDNADQSNMTVAAALANYTTLLASGLRLGAPGVENVSYSTTNDSFNDGAWIKEFMDSCVARGYRVDFIPAHDYVRRTTSSFLERFEALYDRYGIPVWVTEYNYGNPGVGSADLEVETAYTKIKGWTDALEGADFIERYNWYYFFGVSSGIGARTSDGSLNITGEYYRDLDTQNPSYTQEVYEQGDYIVTSLADTDNAAIRLFPNPVKGAVLNVDYLDLSIHDITITIYNIQGREVLCQQHATGSIDISQLSDGMYIVKIQTQTNELTKKITIER